MRRGVARDGDVRHRRLRRPQSDEVFRRNTDDGVERRADLYGASQRVRSAAECRLPIGVAEHDNGLTGRHGVFGAAEVAADDRRRIKELEEALAHRAHRHLARGIAGADREVASGVRGGHVERARVTCDIDVSRELIRVAGQLLTAVGGEYVDLMRCRRIVQHRRGAEEHAIHDAEHRGVRADPEGECRDDGRGEKGLGAETAGGVAEVLAQGVEHRRSGRGIRLDNLLY